MCIDHIKLKATHGPEKVTPSPQKVKTNVAQEKQKQTHAHKHCTSSEVYSVGSAVLKKDFTWKKRKGGKLDSNWIGPFTITKSPREKVSIGWSRLTLLLAK